MVISLHLISFKVPCFLIATQMIRSKLGYSHCPGNKENGNMPTCLESAYQFLLLLYICFFFQFYDSNDKWCRTRSCVKRLEYFSPLSFLGMYKHIQTEIRILTRTFTSRAHEDTRSSHYCSAVRINSEKRHFIQAQRITLPSVQSADVGYVF